MSNTDIRNSSRIPYSSLNLLFYFRIEMFKDDIEMFSKYNISFIKVDELEMLKSELAACYDDVNLVYTQKEATYIKNQTKEDVLKSLLFLKSQMLNCINNSELKILVPLIFKLSTLKDNDILICAQNVYELASKKQSELQEFGVTVNYLVKFAELIEKYTSDLFETKSTKSTRKGTTKVRHEITSKVWNAIKQISTSGQSIWLMENNFSKYESYKLPGNYKPKKKKKVDIKPETDLNIDFNI